MALVKNTAPAEKIVPPNPTPVGQFEAPDEDTVATPAANEPTEARAFTPEAPAAPAAAPEPAAAVPAVQAGGAVATSDKQEASAFAKEVEAMKGAADFSYGNFQVYKGISGAIKGTGNCKVNLGRWVKVSMVAWDDRIQVSPGIDTEEAKNCVAYSKDGETVDSVIGKDIYGGWVGRKVKDYVNFLKDNGYPGAAESRFIDVGVVVHEGESKDSKTMGGEIICVALSKSSIPSFSQYQEKLNMKAKAIKRGIPNVVIPEDPFTFYFIAESASKNGKDWTKLKVSDVLTEI